MRLAFLVSLACHSALAATPEKVKEELVKWEGYHLNPYRDGDHWSVGVGHNLSARHQKVRHYSRSEIERFFQSDLKWALDICRKGVKDFDLLPEEAQTICVSLTWGVGRVGFMSFKRFRAALAARDWKKAALELRSSKWATQVSPARLENHVAALLGLDRARIF